MSERGDMPISNSTFEAWAVAYFYHGEDLLNLDSNGEYEHPATALHFDIWCAALLSVAERLEKRAANWERSGADADYAIRVEAEMIRGEIGRDE